MRDVIRRRIGRAREGDAGWTLVELLVAMTIFLGLMAIVTTVMVEVSYQTKDNLARTRAVDNAELGLRQIDRQVRSGNVISDPASETVASSGVDPFYSLRVYTQTDGVYQCVQWRVVYPAGSAYGELQYRSWKPDWQSVGGVRDWSVVSRDVVKPTSPTVVASDPSTWPPFYVDATSPAEASSTAQTIRVTLRIKDPDQRERSKPATVSSVLTGRNTIYGYPADVCGTVPAP
jgi:prepilin-type N-terminal cleavage/methylation domain-containing protein